MIETPSERTNQIDRKAGQRLAKKTEQQMNVLFKESFMLDE